MTRTHNHFGGWQAALRALLVYRNAGQHADRERLATLRDQRAGLQKKLDAATAQVRAHHAAEHFADKQTLTEHKAAVLEYVCEVNSKFTERRRKRRRRRRRRREGEE
mgnify:CR=1 FL=1